MYSSESPSRIVPLVVLWNGFTVPILFPGPALFEHLVLTYFCFHFRGFDQVSSGPTDGLFSVASQGVVDIELRSGASDWRHLIETSMKSVAVVLMYP